MKIGLEVHLQLPTRSKLFCSCPTTAEQPNTAVCPTCLGFPGSRPVMNRRALQLGLIITKFLDCKVNEKVWFSRKTYFYPDLPKDFQITQYESPLGTDGHFTLNDHRIGIWRVHLEEDPGRIKRVGRSGEEVSFIDYNRSGIPLVEIVSAPDLRSPDEAREYIDMLVTELRHLVGLSVQDEQTVRVDANISVGEERVEVKNVQGLRNLERALRYEANRQTKVLEAGKKIVRETRRYDEERKVTLPAREKEFEEDYGYIGEPDLGEFTIGPMARELVVPETPYRRAERLAHQYGIEHQTARQLVSTSWSMADLFESLCASVPVEKALTWLLGPISAYWSKFEVLVKDGHTDDIGAVIKADVDGTITDNEARLRLLRLIGEAEHESGPTCEPGSNLESLVDEYLEAHPEVLEDCKRNPKAANRVIGHLMKETKGLYSSKDIVSCVEAEVKKRLG
ncbi:MAG: Asp-tRNA(Asn)/Glu-tRNA(Gln) amidotransferase subunit GatB [Methanomassiliicoccales archaeon]|nr:Asp-tRNA(Asn)/Glu-tRNA(Gln) amidotransferase subunit GatB [Methanomassiliicoccales archaeon]